MIKNQLIIVLSVFSSCLFGECIRRNDDANCHAIGHSSVDGNRHGDS